MTESDQFWRGRSVRCSICNGVYLAKRLRRPVKLGGRFIGPRLHSSAASAADNRYCLGSWWAAEFVEKDEAMDSKVKATCASVISGGVLPMWIVYESPSDHPGKFVARRWEIARGSAMATAEHHVADSLDAIRRMIPPICRSLIPRQPGDDPVIRECWI